MWLSYLDMAWTATPEVRRARTIIPTSLLGNQGWNEMIGPEDTLLAEDTWPHPVSSALCFISSTHPPSLLGHVSMRQCDKRTNTDRMRSKVIPPWSLFFKIFLETVSLSVHCLGKNLRLERIAFSCGFWGWWKAVSKCTPLIFLYRMFRNTLQVFRLFKKTGPGTRILLCVGPGGLGDRAWALHRLDRGLGPVCMETFCQNTVVVQW